MTPEQKAVIDAARAWAAGDTAGTPKAKLELERAMAWLRHAERRTTLTGTQLLAEDLPERVEEENLRMVFAQEIVGNLHAAGWLLVKLPKPMTLASAPSHDYGAGYNACLQDVLTSAEPLP